MKFLMIKVWHKMLVALAVFFNLDLVLIDDYHVTVIANGVMLLDRSKRFVEEYARCMAQNEDL